MRGRHAESDVVVLMRQRHSAPLRTVCSLLSRLLYRVSANASLSVSVRGYWVRG